MKTIAHIRTDFPTKFGVPRQSGLVEQLRARVVFEPAYRSPDALRGLEGFSHIWLIWRFSLTQREGWSATVRPPRLGGNVRLGVFATRSPFRPTHRAVVRAPGERRPLHARRSGADRARRGHGRQDPHPGHQALSPLFRQPSRGRGRLCAAPCASAGWRCKSLRALLLRLPQAARDALIEVLAQDPRPAISATTSASTACPLPAWTCAFACAGTCSRWWKSRPPRKEKVNSLLKPPGKNRPPRNESGHSSPSSSSSPPRMMMSSGAGSPLRSWARRTCRAWRTDNSWVTRMRRISALTTCSISLPGE